MADRKITWRTKLESRGYKGGAREIERTTVGMDNVLEGAYERMGAAALNFGADAARAAAQWTLDGARMADAARLAADNAEKVLGPALEGLRDRFSESRQAMGLNILEFDQLIARMGLTTESFGLTNDEQAEFIGNMLETSAELAAFTPQAGDAADALDSIRKALLGERDPLEQFGVKLLQVDIDERIEELRDMNSALDDQQLEILAVTQLINEQAIPAFGAFAESQEGLAGKTLEATTRLEDLQIEIGEQLTPVLIEAADRALSLFDAINFLGDASIDGEEKARSMAAALLDMMLTLNPLTHFFRTASEKIGGFENRLRQATGAVSSFGRSFVNNLSIGGRLRLPSFQSGGIVGGPSGAPQLAVVHGGERVLTKQQQRGGGGFGGTPGGGIVINVSAGISSPAETAEAVVDLLELYVSQQGALPAIITQSV